MSTQLRNKISLHSKRITTDLKDVLDTYPIEPYIDAILNYPELSGYKYISDDVLRICDRIRKKFGKESLYRLHALLLLALMQRSLQRINNMQLTDEIRALCLLNFSRIADYVSSLDFTHMDYGNNRFEKDLSASSMRLLSVGAQKLEMVRFPLFIIERRRLRGRFYAFKFGRWSTWYEMHTDTDDFNLMADYNEDGWRRFYIRAADLLELNPSIAGLVSASWYFDPALKGISPRLQYLRNLVMNNGGISFRLGTSDADIRDALEESKNRIIKR